MIIRLIKSIKRYLIIAQSPPPLTHWPSHYHSENKAPIYIIKVVSLAPLDPIHKAISKPDKTLDKEFQCRYSQSIACLSLGLSPFVPHPNDDRRRLRYIMMSVVSLSFAAMYIYSSGEERSETESGT